MLEGSGLSGNFLLAVLYQLAPEIRKKTNKQTSNRQVHAALCIPPFSDIWRHIEMMITDLYRGKSIQSSVRREAVTNRNRINSREHKVRARSMGHGEHGLVFDHHR